VPIAIAVLGILTVYIRKWIETGHIEWNDLTKIALAVMPSSVGVFGYRSRKSSNIHRTLIIVTVSTGATQTSNTVPAVSAAQQKRLVTGDSYSVKTGAAEETMGLLSETTELTAVTMSSGIGNNRRSFKSINIRSRINNNKSGIDNAKTRCRYNLPCKSQYRRL
jgi:hypothetical protein